MEPTNSAISALTELMKSSARENDIYTQVAASRAMLAIYRHFPQELNNSRFSENVNKIEEVTGYVSRMLGLHLGQSWDKYFRTVKWWARHNARKQRTDWVDLQRRVLKMRAVSRVHEVLLATYPEAMKYTEIGRIFTPRDLKHMSNTFSGFSG